MISIFAFFVSFVCFCSKKNSTVDKDQDVTARAAWCKQTLNRRRNKGNEEFEGQSTITPSRALPQADGPES